jgi:hypothetical protein
MERLGAAASHATVADKEEETPPDMVQTAFRKDPSDQRPSRQKDQPDI